MRDNIAFKITKIFFLTVFYLIIALLLLFSIATLGRKRENQVPNIFGLGFLTVNENATSMVGPNKDSFNPNDLIFVKVLTKKQQENLDLKKLFETNSIVTFYDRQIGFNTHRVVSYELVNNVPVIRTQGDNEDNMDSIYLEASDIIAIYSSKIPKAGKVISFMQKPIGFGTIVLLPMLMLLIYQGYKLIKNVYVVKEANLKESLSLENELQREKLKEELLREIEKEKLEGK